LDGGEYVFHAWLEKQSRTLSEVYLPVRLTLGIHPITPLPAKILPGATYSITLQWQELPSMNPDDPTPLDRPALWDSLEVGQQHYEVMLELRSNGRPVASESYLTQRGTDSHVFSIVVPASVSGPFTWAALVRTAPNLLSH